MPDSGITHDVFNDVAAPDVEAEADDGGEGAAKEAQVESEDILTSYKGVVYVKEVVREPRMHFLKVPRLGCYLAVPLVYQSCIFDEALDKSVEDT